MIAADAAARDWAKNHLVYLGDYIDRGPNSREVLALAMGDSPAGFHKIALRGNHEAMLLNFLDDPVQGVVWLRWGGGAVLRNYGIDVPAEFAKADQLKDTAAQLSAALQPHTLDFLQRLKPHHREGGYFFAHAGVRPGTPLEAQTEKDLVWIRKEFLECRDAFGAVVVHGHSVVPEVTVRPNRIGIDTGAYATGKLTCLVLEANRRWLLQTGQPHPAATPLIA